MRRQVLLLNQFLNIRFFINVNGTNNFVLKENIFDINAIFSSSSKYQEVM